MNILFKSIEINNFLSIGSGVNIQLCERGFTLVSGHNLETKIPQSNGSGKSAIFDAIFWTLTGETLRGASHVQNEKTSEPCECTLVLEVNGVNYTIKRSKSYCYFYENDELLSDQIKKSQEMINKTLPTTSSDILGSIVLLGQGLPYRFSALSPIKRKDLLEIMSGSSSQTEKLKYQLEVESEEYSSKLLEVKTEISSCNSEILGLERSLDTLSKQLDEVSDPTTVQNEIDSLIKDSENCKLKAEEISSKLPDLSSRLSKFEDLLSNLNDYASKVSAEVKILKNQLGQIKSGNCPTCGRPYENQEESSKKIREINESISTNNSTLAQLEAKKSSITIQINEIKNEIRSADNQITSLNHQIDLNNVKSEELKRLLGKSKDLTYSIDVIKSDIKSLRIKINMKEKSLEELQQYVDCIGYLKRQVSRDFKGYVLDEVIKYLSTRSKYYSDYLFSGNDKIEVELSGNKILISVGSRLYENLSGGERQRVDLAVQFALRDMLVTTSGFSCNILVLDEAFDNLDAQGSESLINLITSEFFDIDSVFVVTHHSTIAIPYDNILLVTKNSSGISTVEERS